MGSSPEIYIDPLLLMKRQKANSLENITWSDLGKQNIQAKGLFPGVGTPQMKGVGMMLVSLRGVNYGFLGVLGKTPSYLAVKVSFRVAREKI